MCRTIWISFTVALSAFLSASHAAEPQKQAIDFRYAPPWWQTSICLPDDWQKTLVGKDGELLYDWGGGQFYGFHTRISVTLPQSQWLKQELQSPRAAIVNTHKKAGAIAIEESAFAIAPPIRPQPKADAPRLAIERLDDGQVLYNWANPPADADPGFKHIAVAMNGSIRYRFRAEPNAQYTVVFGLCEGWHQEASQRILDLQVEGKTLKTVDLIKEKGRNVPALFSFPAKDENADGWINVTVAPTQGCADQNTILNTLWIFKGDQKPGPDLIKSQTPEKPLAKLSFADQQQQQPPGPPRQDVMSLQFKNTAAQAQQVQPTITIESDMPITVEDSRVLVGPWTAISCTDPFVVAEQPKGKLVLKLKEISLGANETKQIAIGVARGETSWRIANNPAEASAFRQQAMSYWLKADLPFSQITVGDAGVQAMLESSIRNIYQAREIKEDLPAFQVGPTCYRGLWVVDGSFLMEAVTFIGRGNEARNGIRYLLKRQNKDGGFLLMDGHWKETGIVLWAVARHAKLMGDKAWLAEVWPNVERGFAFIRKMRDMASENGTAPNYWLIPAGFSDGGLGEKRPEYTNIYWTMAGMKAAVEAARWMGKTDQANAWQKEYDDFSETFRVAAKRDMIQDANGNACLPIYMRNTPRVPPQKAQWAFLHAIFPGKVFAGDDPLVKGNMAMLRAVESEGLVLDTGWLGKGIWNYFGSFYGHAWLWLGDHEKAIETLYAFGNHASPLMVWREEHMPQGQGAGNVGDMPHNWASAEFIRLVRHCLVLERGDELHLFEALPREWVQPGMVNRLKDIATEFGPISLELKVSQDGAKASLHLEPPKRNPPKRIVLHLDGWSAEKGAIDLATADSDREIRLR